MKEIEFVSSASCSGPRILLKRQTLTQDYQELLKETEFKMRKLKKMKQKKLHSRQKFLRRRYKHLQGLDKNGVYGNGGHQGVINGNRMSGVDHLFQYPQYGTYACSKPLYNLNSPPRREAVGSICESSFQPVPSTPSLRRTGQENGFLEKITATTRRTRNLMQTIVDPISTEMTEQQDGCGQNDLGFDLNKTRQQKPSKRRIRFMPKVKVEGEPKRKPHKPVTQEDGKSKETGSGKRKKAQKTNLKESATKKPATVEHMRNKSPQVTLKSCRKALNFDLEKSGDVRQGDSESEVVQNASGSYSFSETTGNSGSCLDSVTQVDQTNGLVATNQTPRNHSQPDVLIGTAGTCQRSNIPEYGSLQQDFRQANGYIPFQGRCNGEPFDVCKKTSFQNSAVPTPVLTKLVEARGSKRQYDRAIQNHGLNPAGCWSLVQQISQTQDVERHNLAAKKMKIQKGVQTNLRGMPPAVIEIEDDPTDGANVSKTLKRKGPAGRKTTVPPPAHASDNEKCMVPKTPKRKGPAGRNKTVPRPAHASDNEKCMVPKTAKSKVWEPPLAKKSSSRSKAKEKGKKSTHDSGKSTGGRTREQDQEALVLYKGDGAVVPYEVKEQKPRPKVDLDDETTRIWNLLTGKGEGDEEADKKKEKWWEEERRVFRGRADLFISRMHLVQGDRRFSPWKGSVVDSVIGVFLTQNVSDHLSSSAFMSLAARFPPKSYSNQEDETHVRSVVVEDPEGCILNLNDTPSQIPSSETQVSGVDSGSKEQQRDCSNSGIERFDFLENSCQNLEEEVLSSQDSFDPAIFQLCGGIGSCSGSKSDAEFSTTRCEINTVSGSSQSEKSGSPNLSDETCCLGNGRPILYEGPGDVQIQGTASVTQKKPNLDKTTNCKDSSPSFGEPGNHTNWQKGQTNPSSSYEQSAIQKPYVLDIEDFGMPGDGMGYPWLSISPRADKGNNKKIPRRVVRKGGNVDPRSLQNTLVESNSSNNDHTGIEFKETNSTIVREMKAATLADGKKPTRQWDSLREDVVKKKGTKERSEDSKDSIDYEAIRSATVSEIADSIKERGMNNMLAVRIKDFLDRIVKDHGALDLEWLRDVPADKAKDYLLSIRGLGLKSVECVRLLTLLNLAFPVDTNVGRIAVRLGWVPLQPLPESLQLHLLELYPVLESIQKFLWPRLCKLDQRTLYELHYQLITFGKVFCTKSRPNCNACPMRGECRHFASAYASARLALPAPALAERSLTSATIPVHPESIPPASIPMMELPPPPLERALTTEAPSNGGNCEPVIEEPASTEQECTEITESDIEDAYYNEDLDEIPTIKLNIEQFGMTLRDVMERNMELQEGDMSKALVALNPATTSIPTAKLKNISRLRTEHQVYELPDSHPLLDGMDKRERDDPSPYLLAIWAPGETANAAQPPGQKCGGKGKGKAPGKMCFEETCSECNINREANSQTVRGTLLIPCRTATRGSFPLNGTYFQVNELFADHDSSLKPINVPRDWIWNLPRRTDGKAAFSCE